jgi:hypothetical protein
MMASFVLIVFEIDDRGAATVAPLGTYIYPLADALPEVLDFCAVPDWVAFADVAEVLPTRVWAEVDPPLFA